MKAWHRWLAFGLALAGALSACGDRTPTGNATTNNPVDIGPAPVPPPPPPQGPMTLAQAVAAGVATVTASGQSLTEVRLTVTATQPVQLTIPVGTLLASGDAGAQNMMTAETVEVSLDGTPETPARQEIPIPAYCINFHREIPTGDTSFAVTEADTERRPLQALADCLVRQDGEHEVKQNAMWAISDRWAYMTADQYVADRVQRAGSSDGDPSDVADQAQAEVVAFRTVIGPILARCGYDLSALPLFAAQ